jgi:hypothetical protein
MSRTFSIASTSAAPSTATGSARAEAGRPQRSSRSISRASSAGSSSPRATAIRDSTTMPNATASPCSSGP